jgi:hypothetical protein
MIEKRILAQTYRAWARMRSQMSQLKMLVLGVQGN